MTYEYRVLQDNPIGFWPLNTSFTFDYSGYNKFIVRSGGLIVLPIVAGGSSAVQLSGTNSFSYPISNMMIAGKPLQAFTVEAWLKVNIAGDATLMARNSSGLFINGDTLTFSVLMGSSVSASWARLEPGNNYHIVAIYDTESVYLYVNGEMVASSVITTENILGDFADTATSLKTTPGTATVTLDSVAMYLYPMSEATVASHYQWGTDYPDVETIAMNNGAITYRIWDGAASVYDKATISGDDWSLGTLTNVAVVDGQLINVYDEVSQAYLPGVWQYSLSYEPDTVTIAGSRLSWESYDDIIVETSFDEIKWQPVTNGSQPVSDKSLSEGLEILVRVSLPGGTSPSVVTSLSLVMYSDNIVHGSDTDSPAVIRNMSSSVLSEIDFDPAAFNENAGVYQDNITAGLRIDRDVEFSSVYALEFWVELRGPNAGKMLFESGTASVSLNTNGGWVSSGLSALYIDGVSQNLAGSSVIAQNTPHHVFILFNQPLTTSVYLGNNAVGSSGMVKTRIGYVSLYLSPVASSDISKIYGSWVGTAIQRINDGSVTSVREKNYTDSGTAVRGYAYDWSISSSG